MIPFLRQVLIFLGALVALATLLLMIRTAKAAELNQGDGTRQIVVEASARDKGAASTDLTDESGATPAQTLATDDPAPPVSNPATESDQAELTDREAIALAQHYALYLSTAYQRHGAYGYSTSHRYGYTRRYDDCDY
jgi:hypothetical protein